MAWTDPRTWATGELVTAAMLNTHLRDNLKAIGDPWTSYTPTLTNFTLGSGTLVGKYAQMGKTVRLRIYIAGGAGAVATGILTVSLPSGLTRAGADDEQIIPGHHFDSTNRPAWGLVRSAGVLIQSTSTGSWVSSWASGHVIHLQGDFEVA